MLDWNIENAFLQVAINSDDVTAVYTEKLSSRKLSPKIMFEYVERNCETIVPGQSSLVVFHILISCT